MWDRTTSRNRCAVCGELKDNVEVLASGPRAGTPICADCVSRLSAVIVTRDSDARSPDRGERRG